MSLQLEPLEDQLRKYRKRSNLTQEQLAELAKISSRTVQEIESGRVTTPHTNTVQNLITVLNLSEQEKLDFEYAARNDIHDSLQVGLSNPHQDVLPKESNISVTITIKGISFYTDQLIKYLFRYHKKLLLSLIFSFAIFSSTDQLLAPWFSSGHIGFWTSVAECGQTCTIYFSPGKIGNHYIQFSCKGNDKNDFCGKINFFYRIPNSVNHSTWKHFRSKDIISHNLNRERMWSGRPNVEYKFEIVDVNHPVYYKFFID